MKAFIIITDNGQYILFSLTKGQATEHFKTYTDENVISIFEVGYDNIYILRK